MVALIRDVGPAGVQNILQYADDGLAFSKMSDLKNVPLALGAYRPEAFTDSGQGKMISWGVQIGTKRGYLPFLERFQYTWQQETAAE